MTVVAAPPNLEAGLLRGRGPDLGPYARRYPPHERTMLRVLADRAADRPDKPWLVFDGTDVLTFGDAWRAVCRVGHALDRAGLDPGAHVGLLLRNQVEFMPAFYGAQVRGGRTVPLNADSRGPLLQQVIEHSDVEVIVARADLVDRLQALGSLGRVRLVVVVGDGPLPDLAGIEVVAWDAWLAGAPDDHAWPFPPHDARCLIQYTSGTTARAKGAVYTHSFLYLYAAMCTDSQERTEDDVLTAPLPLFHVAALHIIANSSLHAGCTGHLKSRFSASRYWEQCAADGATWAILLGPMAAMIAKMTPDPVPKHKVTRCFCPPPPPDHEEWERRFAPVKLIWWGYGMTEVYPLPMIDPDLQDRSLPMDTIGMPVAWMDYGVVDAHDELLGPNEVGELVFRPRIPHALVSEYYRDPERTVEAFRNLLFHTGDLATYDEQGLLHYRSRVQDRIRRRGENVSAPELEWVALTHTHVVEAAAYGVASELGEEDVKLDVVLGEALAAAALHAWLCENLPRHMVPRYIELRESFPKTPSERIEKYKLKAEPVDRPEVFDADAAPTEQTAG